MIEQLYPIAGIRKFEDDWGYDPKQPDAKVTNAFSAAKREFLRKLAVTGGATAVTPFLAACGGGKPAAAPEAAQDLGPNRDIKAIDLNELGGYIAGKEIRQERTEFDGQWFPDTFPEQIVGSAVLDGEQEELDEIWIPLNGGEYIGPANRRVESLRVRAIDDIAKLERSANGIVPFGKGEDFDYYIQAERDTILGYRKPEPLLLEAWSKQDAVKNAGIEVVDNYWVLDTENKVTIITGRKEDDCPVEIILFRNNNSEVAGSVDITKTVNLARADINGGRGIVEVEYNTEGTGETFKIDILAENLRAYIPQRSNKTCPSS